MGYAAMRVREVAEWSYGSAAAADSIEPNADALEDLADEIATLAAHIHAATHRLLTLIAQFDRLRGWELGGHASCAHWLHVRTGIDLGAAREKLRAARALESLPLTSAAMARGQLSFSKVRALTRVATGANEGELLELACGATTAQLERMMRAWKKGSRQDEAERERLRYESRTLSIYADDDGMYVVRGLLPPEVGALLMRATDAASDALYREADPLPTDAHAEETLRAAAQRRGDAVGLIAERALAAGLGAGDGSQPISGTRAERYQVVLHVEPATLSVDEEPGRSELEDGTRVSAETSRRLSCDASVVCVTHAKDGSILDLGRKTRTISPALRRALEIRDRGCRFPGCGRRFTDGHHVKRWDDGGETSLTNCVLLCSYHHRLVHEGGWRVEWWGAGRPMFYSPRGEMAFDGRWQPPELPADATSALIDENGRRGADPDAWTARARWLGASSIPMAISSRALEALL